MQRHMLKSKIHRATVTGVRPRLRREHHPRSRADAPAPTCSPNEQVHVWDIENGARFVTYAIEGDAGSGEIQVNGAAARLVSEGDKVIIASFGAYSESDLEVHSPIVVHVDESNAHHPRRLRPGCCSTRHSLRGRLRGAGQPDLRREQPMSTHPHRRAPGAERPSPVTLPRLAEMKATGEPIVMVTAYDYPSAARRRGGRRRRGPRRRHGGDGRARLRRDRPRSAWTRC